MEVPSSISECPIEERLNQASHIKGMINCAHLHRK